MSVLGNLKPEKVFQYFEEICSIPHGSYNTKGISDYLKKFAKERGLECYQDDANNIIIIKEATAGYEDADPIILQGHMDMVCEKTPDRDIDFEKDGLEIYIDGDWVRAKGTTLGGDNGIAVAMSLAILDSDEYEHPRLEVVATTDEEVGMLGAEKMDTSHLTAKKFINIDSEEEGIFTVSCAGGVTVTNHIPIEREKIQGTFAELKVDGLLGGHSGIEIDRERGNANIVLARALYRISKTAHFRIVSLEGGKKDNAITNLSKATILFGGGDSSFAKGENAVKEFSEILSHEYRVTDPDVKVELIKEGHGEGEALTLAATKNVVFYLLNSPQGVQNMSKEIDGLVETSLNLGILELGNTEMTAAYAVRSSLDSRREFLVHRLEALAKLVGGYTKQMGEYPGWEYMADSKLRETAVKVFKDMYGREPEIEAIHAGLECGLFAGKIKGLDCISIGPDMTGVHTPDEKLSIQSTERTFDFLVELLRESR